MTMRVQTVHAPNEIIGPDNPTCSPQQLHQTQERTTGGWQLLGGSWLAAIGW